VEILSRYLAVSYPLGPKLPEGFSWKNQKIGVYFWRTEDAGYFFQTKVLDDFADKQYPILHILHSENLIRAQKRNSVRVEADIPAELFPLKSIDGASETPEGARGLRCRLSDISEGGLAVLIGGKAKVGLPIKVQFSIGENQVVMSGVVKGINFDQKKNRSLLHVQANPLSPTARNRVLMYVYNLFGERETPGAARKPDTPAKDRGTDGIVIKAGPSAAKPASDVS
jgi:c-di-GMP-binding flagellar brake protein YcgR